MQHDATAIKKPRSLWVICAIWGQHKPPAIGDNGNPRPLAGQVFYLTRGRSKLSARENLESCLSLEDDDGYTPEDFKRIDAVWFEHYIWSELDRIWVFTPQSDRNRSPVMFEGCHSIPRIQIDRIFERLRAKRSKEIPSE